MAPIQAPPAAAEPPVSSGWILVLLTVLGGLWVGARTIWHFGRYVESLDRRLARIEEHMGIQPPKDAP